MTTTENPKYSRFQLPEIEDASKLLSENLELPGVLIDGLLHIGSKLVIGGSSKSFKTWSLIDLAVSVSTGTEWWGRRTCPAPVLYMNFEIQSPFFSRRLDDILQARRQKLQPGQFDVWNLRGHSENLTTLIDKALGKIEGRNYGLIILDPIYKCLGGRDENKTGDITSLMNEVEKLAVEKNAAVAFGAHFSKGNQALKESIDRISGSGVFARDPDSILVMTRHEVENAFTVEATLRNFPPTLPFCVEWKFPLLVPVNLDPQAIKQSGARSKTQPTNEEFVAIFPEVWPKEKPRKGLLSNAELAKAFKLLNYDKNDLVVCRDRAEADGLIAVVRGLPHNQVLAGLPAAVNAFNALS